MISFETVIEEHPIFSSDFTHGSAILTTYMDEISVLQSKMFPLAVCICRMNVVHSEVFAWSAYFLPEYETMDFSIHTPKDQHMVTAPRGPTSFYNQQKN